MSLDWHNAALLKYCSKNKPFGDTATLGRLAVHKETAKNLKLTFPELKNEDLGEWADKVFYKLFKSTKIDAYDADEFEGAVKVANFNFPVKESELYDTFVDIGSSEHVFDIAQSFKNIIKLTKIGGTIIHALPANNFCGHGFWQFSPELFYELYSPENGFAKTEVFIIDWEWIDSQIKNSKKGYVIKMTKELANYDIGFRYVRAIKGKNMLGIWSKTTKVENKEIRNVTQSRYKKDNWVGKYKVNENKNISTVDRPEPRTIEILATRYLKKFPRLYPILKKLYHLSFFSKVLPRIRYILKYKKFENYKNHGEKVYIADLIK